MKDRGKGLANRKLSVLFINRSYWPDVEATGQLLTELCEDLATSFDVEVLAGRPNHHDAEYDETPTGTEVHDGSQRNGVRISRVPHTRFRKHSLIGKLLNLTTFTSAAFLKTLFRKRPDIVVTESDPFFLSLLGRWLKFRYHCRFVVYLQDIYPDVAIAVGRVSPGFITRSLRRALVSSYNAADRVVVVSEQMRERCISNGVQSNLIQVVPNWADCERIRPIKSENSFRTRHKLDDQFVVMYSGNLGSAHDLTALIDAAEDLCRDEIQFVFVGEGVQKNALKARVDEKGLSNVLFLGYQPKSGLSESLSAADVHIVSLRPGVQGCVMPSKLYGIFASGTAVLAICPSDSEVGLIVNDNDVGAVCPNDVSTGLSDRIRDSLRTMRTNFEQTKAQGARARAVCLRRYDRSKAVASFRTILESPTGGSRAIS